MARAQSDSTLQDGCLLIKGLTLVEHRRCKPSCRGRGRNGALPVYQVFLLPPPSLLHYQVPWLGLSPHLALSESTWTCPQRADEPAGRGRTEVQALSLQARVWKSSTAGMEAGRHSARQRMNGHSAAHGAIRHSAASRAFSAQYSDRAGVCSAPLRQP